ncbi:MAG: aldehyde dehydrogenase family protein, partial [Planctomycetota bacterium]
VLPGAIANRGQEIVDEFITSVLMGAGQFCTNPGLVLLLEDETTDPFIGAVAERFASSPAGTLLSPSVAGSLSSSIKSLTELGAQIMTGGGEPESGRCAMANTLLTASGEQFLTDPEGFQTEAFGNASLIVVAKDLGELCSIIASLEGNLTGCIYSDSEGVDEEAYEKVSFELAPKVGRLLNDKMPTGVAVSPAMNHGGPYPATGHPGFTAVGVPGSLLRFAKLTSFDSVRESRLPKLLRDANPTGTTARLIDGEWSIANI